MRWASEGNRTPGAVRQATDLCTPARWSANRFERGPGSDTLGQAGIATRGGLRLKDPVCGMLVEIASARHRSEASGRVVYFCCAGCKEAFERDPQRYATALAG